MEVSTLEPHFYTRKVGFTGVCTILFIFAQNMESGYTLELSHWDRSISVPTLYVLSKRQEKYHMFFILNYRFNSQKIAVHSKFFMGAYIMKRLVYL